MMRFVSLSLALASASAFLAPGARRLGTKLASAEGMIGADVETGGKVFDPLGFSAFAPAEFLREAELKNGRVAMLGLLGWVGPEFLGKFPSTDVESTHAWDALAQVDPQFWFQILGLCGIVEAADYRHKSLGLEGPFFDPAGIAPKNPEDMKKMQLKELKNGRAAMIGFAAAAAAHYVPGSVPGYPFPH